ncbi:hypothetical protein C2S52_022670 [Perilla frutescens var. hirtella]|nr:hypothetical protein C2S52_022670 [Perilla frutescens var. hirtella]KAH6806965.1 hypothetical protein C2S51_028073 [Perilla frutescens var. frutescens]
MLQENTHQQQGSLDGNSKKPNRLIPAHLVAEAISTLHGLDLRWSGPITPTEMQYVEQYVLAKYPEYCNGLVMEEAENIDLYSICINDSSSPNDDKKKSLSSSPNNTNSTIRESSSSNITKIQLDPSKLLDALTKKASYQGNFMSIPEIQARNRALQSCGLSEDDYLVVFTSSVREAMMMVGESYPFFRGNYYMTILGDDVDITTREFVTFKDSKVVAAPAAWLDLRIKGSQLSQYFRRKCKYSPKGLFAYPVCTTGSARSSMHWISEAHRNSWHVLLDATGLDAVKDRLALALHRPDFVTCTVDITHSDPSKVTCLLVRKKSFETSAALPSA